MCASAAVIPITSFIIALTTLLSVLVYVYFYNRIPSTFSYINTCASAAVIITTAFPIHLNTLLCVLVQQ